MTTQIKNWAIATVYIVGQQVIYNDKLYICEKREIEIDRIWV